MRIISSLITIIIGVVLIRKTYGLAGFFGTIGFAEKYLGPGGTYTFFKIVGAIFVVIGALRLFGLGGIFLSPFSGLFGGP